MGCLYVSSGKWLAAGQVAGATAVLATVVLAPPAHGRMLLVPLPFGASPGSLISRSYSVLGSGPLPGSILIRGDRTSLILAGLSKGVLVIGAPPILCGTIGGADA